MSQYLLKIHDLGNNWLITDYTFYHNDQPVDPLLYRVVDEPLYRQILELLKTNNIQFSKEVNNLTLDDLILIPIENPLDKYKYDAIMKLENFVGDRIRPFEMFKFFNFLRLHDMFYMKGIIITDTNREEEYLKIIEKQDTEEIKLLEEYLYLRDDISENGFLYSRYKESKSEIEAAANEEETDSIVISFLNAFE